MWQHMLSAVKGTKTRAGRRSAVRRATLGRC